MAAQISGSPAPLARLEPAARGEAGASRRRRLGACVAAAMALAVVVGAGQGAAAEDGRSPAGQDAAFPPLVGVQKRKPAAGPRLYAPLRSADREQADKQFAIGEDTAFGVQSEELIRAGRDARDPSQAGVGVGDGGAKSPIPPPPLPGTAIK
jgi:hypothetical protein